MLTVFFVGAESCLSGFGFGFEADLAVFKFYAVFDGFAVVILADLFGFLFDEGLEGIKICGAGLAGFFLGLHHGLKERFYTLAVGFKIVADNAEGLVGSELQGSGSGMFFRGSVAL